MEIPEGEKPSVLETVFIYAKEGKEQVFTIDNLPGDTTWTFVDSKTIVKEKGYEPPIQDFHIVSQEDGLELTDTILGDDNYTFLLVAPWLERADDSSMDLINEVYDYSVEHGYRFLCLTASGDEYSVVAGLDMGADDYIAKPFRPRELISRIRSVLRRCKKEQRILSCGDLKVNVSSATVTKGEKELFLSALEYRLLLLLLQNKGQILTRNQLLEEIWDASGEYVNDNTLSVYMKRLREKIEENPQSPRLLHTIRGIGYRMEDRVE